MKTDKPERDGINWVREEAILAFDLYCRIPFRKTKANNPEVIRLAHLLGRTPASVARKLGNFGSFDPELKKKDISGLGHSSKLDESIWNEFNTNWSALVIEANRLRSFRERALLPATCTPQIPDLTGKPTERIQVTKQRIYQDFFRQCILSGFNRTCCMCGLPHTELLIASHIIPWSAREDTRVNPQNGLCLCASHDMAYEKGLIGIGTDFSILLGDKAAVAKDPASNFLFASLVGRKISMPDRFLPSPDFLSWRLQKFNK